MNPRLEQALAEFYKHACDGKCRGRFAFQIRHLEVSLNAAVALQDKESTEKLLDKARRYVSYLRTHKTFADLEINVDWDFSVNYPGLFKTFYSGKLPPINWF